MMPTLDVLEAALELVPDAVLIADDDGHYVFANAAACALLGCTAEEVLSLSPADIAQDGYQTEEQWKAFRKHKALTGEFPLKRRDGTTAIVQFNATADIAPNRHLSVLRDITNSKRIEENLRRNEERFLQAFLCSPVPTTIRLLSTGAFVEANEAFTKLTGLFRADIIGHTAAGVWDDPGTMTELLATLRSGTDSVSDTVTVRRKNRSTGTLLVSARRAEIHGEPHAVTTYQDLSVLSAR